MITKPSEIKGTQRKTRILLHKLHEKSLFVHLNTPV